MYHKPCCVTRSLNSNVNMLIRSKTLKSIIIRETRSYTGTHGGLSPAIHRDEPHLVRHRYQISQNGWLSSRHSTIGQPVQSRKSVVPGFKNKFSTLVEATPFFCLCQHPFRHNCSRGTSRLAEVPRCTSFFSSTVRNGLARVRAPRPRAAQLSLCTPEKLVSRDGSGSTFFGTVHGFIYTREL